MNVNPNLPPPPPDNLAVNPGLSPHATQGALQRPPWGLILTGVGVLACLLATCGASALLWVMGDALNPPTLTPTLTESQRREQALSAQLDPVISGHPALFSQVLAVLRPLELTVYDPVTGDQVRWSLDEMTWASWWRARTSVEGQIVLDVDAAGVEAYLQAQASAYFDPTRTLDFPQTAAELAHSLANGGYALPLLRVRHLPRSHTVQSGETITSIAWDYGIPYPYLLQLNGGREVLSVGETIAIPPADSFLLLPPVPNKRLVVSIGQQRVWAWEDGALKWDWPASTGIASSPTWRGVYQVISKVPNAYAANWNLWMPNFLGVYRPVPDSDFTNGFHGFPTRGGGQLLWENNLGRPVTYGCILVSSANAQLLYDWAELGVVVEIRG
ncbi:MAG: L,D-transpeptidase family protein [Anaerolineae bacterium]|nr:L,D-transpeptidase family protein [Anaerolineae bacterium]MDW8172944.1 L,D-transpeptidase family protein [Anaerolineae bacterium]